MTSPISAKELKERLKREKTVEVKGMAFSVRKVSLLLLVDDPGQIWEWARAGQDVLSERIKGLLQSPALPAMRRVLLAGVAQPCLSASAGEDEAVPVDLLLAHHDVAAGLFIEIINLSLGG
ncbi:MAG TPA: hypothetical protein DCM05_17760 [Elusimicrobia bacterium]|nr:hypothetical protein [Elusimicrobiota bacterium]